MHNKLYKYIYTHHFLNQNSPSDRKKLELEAYLQKLSDKMEEGKGRVCVTGGGGFIASMIIKRLLLEGYSVNTTVRPGKSKKDLSFLTNLPGASRTLQVFNADLNNPESFIPAIEGCIGVFHTATPYDLQKDEDDKILTKRAIGGALGILKASISSKTVKRVVYTGSAAAIIYSGKEVEDLDESYWSDIDFMYKTKPFTWNIAISQTLTEKAVLEFAEQHEHELDVVTLILPYVIGPFICSKLPTSIEYAFCWLFGEDGLGIFVRYPLVHVDDVARAHIFLLEHPNPKGRFICSLSGTVTFEEIADILQAKFPEFQTPTLESLKEIAVWTIPSINSKKLKDAGFKFNYGTKEIIEETIQCCKENGYL
ncbi:hypothetical protein Lal_00042482 [Lupinus albus]|uniref:Putative vestitone reductase n=1 Tax=Lupinus albus TaxID=3870 RepID=A0A6A4PS46_LUPAL|nr:putative vestitone reductase [Lupinus albus]KAF1892878.1 hypothetical protein Lal_00035421 [Lupinus albus]KAF1892919.1 hypothetical protein Lal_00042482 [Lupinus albus]